MLRPKISIQFFSIIVSVVCILQASPIQGQPSDFEAKTLRGVKAFRVVIEDLDPEAEQAGLSKSTIKTDVELRLRKAGIRIIEENYWPAVKTRLSIAEKTTALKGEKARQKYKELFPWDDVMTKEEEELAELYDASANLYLSVNVMKILEQYQSPHLIYSLKAEVQQTARLERDTSIICYGAVTWNMSSVGIAPIDKASRFIRDAVADKVDAFLNAYLRENQK